MNIEGVKFLCTKCGDCCRSNGTIFLEKGRSDKIASFLNITQDELVDKYPIKSLDTSTEILVITDGKGCPFLAEDSLCSIQEVKPKQCQKYPFWPGQDFKKEAEHCEGLDHEDGTFYSPQEVRKLMFED